MEFKAPRKGISFRNIKISDAPKTDKPKRVITPEQLKKMQDGRKKSN
jgi:hypothetical protein